MAHLRPRLQVARDPAASDVGAHGYKPTGDSAGADRCGYTFSCAGQSEALEAVIRDRADAREPVARAIDLTVGVGDARHLPALH